MSTGTLRQLPKRKRIPNPAEEADARAVAQHAAAASDTYGRGPEVATKRVRNRKLRGNLAKLEASQRKAAVAAKNAELLQTHSAGLLEPETPLERTWQVRQAEIQDAVPVETAKKGFELRLDEQLGPYAVAEYTRNGRDLLLASRKGHVACMDWRDGRLGCEMQLGETVRDACWLHNNQTFAVAQKKCVFIYGRDGVELHRLAKHSEAAHLEFLPYHFLLASASIGGVLRYTDTSTGTSITSIATKLGPTTALTQNRSNAILHMGHEGGTVTLWSPNTSNPLVKLLPHRGPVRAIAIDRAGKYMVSAGQDRRLAIWDLRMYKELRTGCLRQPGSTLSISDRNLTAVGWSTHIDVFSADLLTASEAPPMSTRYMHWGGDGIAVSRAQFCPFEDILGIGHARGFASILVPGAGEPNPDLLEYGTNPFETPAQRSETEVRSVLEKLQPDMISLEADFVGRLDTRAQARRDAKLEAMWGKKGDSNIKSKKKSRGKDNALSRHLQKQQQRSVNVIDERKQKARDMFQTHAERERDRVDKLRVEFGPALARFATKES